MSIPPPAPAGSSSSGLASTAGTLPAHVLSEYLEPYGFRPVSLRQIMDRAERHHDAVWQAHTAEQAMACVQDHLARMHALAVDATNADVALLERFRAQQEVNQRVADVDRIARTTTVAGRYVLDGSGPQSAVLAPVGLPNLRAQFQSGVGYAMYRWNGGVATSKLPFVPVSVLEPAIPVYWQPPVRAVGLTVADQTTVGLGAVPAAFSLVQRLEEISRVVNDFAAKTGVAAFVESTDGAVQLHLLSRRVDAQGRAAPVRLQLGEMQVLVDAASEDGVRDDCQEGGGVGAVHRWQVCTAGGLHCINLGSPAMAWVSQLQLEHAAAQLSKARARFAAQSLLVRLGIGSTLHQCTTELAQMNAYANGLCSNPSDGQVVEPSLPAALLGSPLSPLRS